MAWDRFSVRYDIKSAQIVAAIKDGGIVTEQRDIEYREGRVAQTTIDRSDSREIPILEFVAAFSVPKSEPDASEAVEARIVITGPWNGCNVDIRGDGWFGYDNNGLPEGWFDGPPTIILDLLPADDTAPKSVDEMDEEAWLKHVKAVHPRPSGQYLAAIRGRRLGESKLD